jgi:hypothetical protein
MEMHIHHNYFYPDVEEEPTKEEINIFRLYKCADCGKWISLIGETRNSKAYKELQKLGFTKAYKQIVWRDP